MASASDRPKGDAQTRLPVSKHKIVCAVVFVAYLLALPFVYLESKCAAIAIAKRRLCQCDRECVELESLLYFYCPLDVT